VAHTCSPSYAGDRDQEDFGLKQPRQIVCENLSQKKKKITKIGLVEWLKVKAMSSSPSTAIIIVIIIIK
jgi:hypothetical protein